MTDHKTGTRAGWAAARKELLAREKEHMRLGDELARQRRELPWVPVENEYLLDTDDGPRVLAELFDGRSQLAVYHLIFGPEYKAACPTCSSIADAIKGVIPHLSGRDVTMLFVSQAPFETLQTYKRRMGWSFPWASSANSEFDVDLGYSSSEELTREWVTPILGALPPIAERNAGGSDTDVVGYLTQSQGFSFFILETVLSSTLFDRRSRGRVRDGLLRDSRQGADGTRRRRCIPGVDPPHDEYDSE
jgi:predicted dithiol-disulfide oxidoreductase (DUF899 family)